MQQAAGSQSGAITEQTAAKMEPVADINRNSQKKPFKELPIEIDGTSKK